MDESNIGIIILAAGASSRFGKAKQLIKFQNKTLISKTIETAIETKSKDIVVVLGSFADLITEEITIYPVQICLNKNWQSGIASSIKCGLEKLLDVSNRLDAAIILLCDQALVEIEDINLLIDSFRQTDKKIIAAEYKNIVGVPALFSREIFDDLLKTTGDIGAKKVIAKHIKLVHKVTIESAAFDIDTPEDLENFINKKSLN